MTKWADYAISDVHFNDKHTHIDRVKARLTTEKTSEQPLITLALTSFPQLEEG